MDVKTIVRTSAIIYADENTHISTNTIKRKFIEAIFIDNENKLLDINDLVSAIEQKFDLTFSIDETIEIINKEKDGVFSTIHKDNNIENTLINLTESRHKYLQTKESSNDFEKYTAIFTEKYLGNKINTEEVNKILFKFLFELLNTNIKLYSNILKPGKQRDNLTIDSNKFTDNEICIINDFLAWESSDKNKALFKLISYCIEYSLVSNHSSGDKTYLSALRTKKFYLDNNIIYRAIGINGKARKDRTKIFLKKCINSGQKLFVSKYTKKEFSETIEYHIKQLKKVPFGRINPSLFERYCISPSFYEYYHLWRNGRITYGFDSFHSHIIGEYENMLKQYNIVEDYKIPFDEKDDQVLKTIDKYKEELQKYKPKKIEDSIEFDALNSLFIEKKRNENNINIQDTKYYLITTDQKLKNWDDFHSNNQSITMLPSHWMGLLLKYINRTDDDFNSFVSFLRLRQHENLIDEHSLQIVLSGISEITEDFRRQGRIMEKMVERKFSGIIENNPDKTREEAKLFAKEILEEELEKTINSHKEDINQINSEHSSEVERIQKETSKELEKIYEQHQMSRHKEKYETIIKDIKKISKLKERAEAKALQTFKNKKFIFFSLPVGLFIILFVCVLIFDWNIMEKITWIASALIIGLSYLYVAINGKSFSPEHFFNEMEAQCVQNAYYEYMVDLEELEELENLKKELEQKENAT